MNKEVGDIFKEIKSEEEFLKKIAISIEKEFKSLMQKGKEIESKIKRANNRKEAIETLKEWKEFVREHLNKLENTLTEVERIFA